MREAHGVGKLKDRAHTEPNGAPQNPSPSPVEEYGNGFMVCSDSF